MSKHRVTETFSYEGQLPGKKGLRKLGKALAAVPGAKVEVRTAEDSQWRPVPYVAEPFGGVEWGRALFELAESLRTGAPQRCTGQQAYHVLDICLSILDSAEQERAISVDSTFSPPPPRSFQ